MRHRPTRLSSDEDDVRQKIVTTYFALIIMQSNHLIQRRILTTTFFCFSTKCFILKHISMKTLRGSCLNGSEALDCIDEIFTSVKTFAVSSAGHHNWFQNNCIITLSVCCSEKLRTIYLHVKYSSTQFIASQIFFLVITFVILWKCFQNLSCVCVCVLIVWSITDDFHVYFPLGPDSTQSKELRVTYVIGNATLGLQ